MAIRRSFPWTACTPLDAQTRVPTGVSRIRALRAAGASRTCRRAYPAANGLSRIFEGIGNGLDGPTFTRSIRCPALRYPMARQ